MKNLVAYVISDLHINDWAKFNENDTRTHNQMRILVSLLSKSYNERVPILFCGDLFHKPDMIRPELLDLIFQDSLVIHPRYMGYPIMYAISGNHEINHISKIGEHPVSWTRLFTKMFPWLVCLDYCQFLIKDNIMIHGVPYVDHNIGLSKYLKEMKLDPKQKHILMLHTDYPGARDTDGREVGSVENLNLNVLDRFDLVLCGHIHKPQRLSKKVYMIGAPIQQRRTDRDCDMGYWKLYDDLSMTFVKLKGYPKFIDVESQDEIKDDGNYYTVIPKIASNPVETKHKITKQLTNKTLAKRYMKVKGIKDKNKEQLLIKVLKEADQ
jgi:DNA repair exonuclease SbcCD nuclease subunit